MQLYVFQSVPTVFSPVAGHQWEEHGSVVLILSHQIYIHFDKSSLGLLFSMLNKCSVLSVSSYVRC